MARIPPPAGDMVTMNCLTQILQCKMNLLRICKSEETTCLQQIKEHPKIYMPQHKNDIYVHIYIIMWSKSLWDVVILVRSQGA